MYQLETALSDKRKQRKTALSDRAVEAHCKEIYLILHRLSELGVRDIDVEPGGGACDIVAINLDLVGLVLEPSGFQQCIVGQGYGLKMSMKLTMVDNRYIPYECCADSLSIALVPVAFLVADMMAISRCDRRYSRTLLVLLAHNNTPLSEQTLRYSRILTLVGTHYVESTDFAVI